MPNSSDRVDFTRRRRSWRAGGRVFDFGVDHQMRLQGAVVFVEFPDVQMVQIRHTFDFFDGLATAHPGTDPGARPP